MLFRVARAKRLAPGIDKAFPFSVKITSETLAYMPLSASSKARWSMPWFVSISLPAETT
jgi:hypothetical protein